ncbi:FtsX-like permease family protein [Candidatus Nomurabacteria bacterium]|nr:FtsX-like permease family protein [Candidatus Kaiserbacteria bacterium]MCB9814064.1 FtsX-like permease family protein [Candidatus Nomurabacteria bacterium]
MSALRLILIYSLRIVRREWRRFVLPLASLTITSVVLVLVLLLTASSTALLADQARELQGGDVVLGSAFPIEGEEIISEVGIKPEAVSEQLSFSGTLQSSSKTAPFTVNVIDNSYPLYGEFVLQERPYSGLSQGEILLDAAGLRRLDAQIGDTVSFGSSSLTVVDMVKAEPTALFGGFKFFPTAFISPESFLASGIDPQLLRAEYTYAVKAPDLSNLQVESLRSLQESNKQLDIDIAGQDQRGLQFGLATVSDFLVLAVLITAVLAAVNVYASILYLVTIERRSLAVLLALGLSKIKLVYVLGVALGLVVLLANIIGISVGTTIFSVVQQYIASNYFILLPSSGALVSVLISSGLVFMIAFMSFLPAVRKSLELNPRQILIGETVTASGTKSFKSLSLITVSTLVPLVFLASFLLDSLVKGLLVIGVIAAVYVMVAVSYSFLIRLLYKARKHFSFFIRSIISQKYADGLFGIVSFTSLFIALASLCTLILVQVSLERFLVNDLGGTVPSTYVLDVQPSQKDILLQNFPDLELFSNVRARIIEIDGLLIQDELSRGNTDVSGELGREFNLTARNELLASESVTAGVWSDGRPGEISVDESFAKQANISLGSTLTFSIQGFDVSGTVTSLRSTDSRSGLPFFYFILSPEDIGKFPKVYFGYSYYEPAQQSELGQFLADNMPNVSMIDTQTLGPLLLQIISTLLVLVLVVTIPPLLIATLLIAMLVVSSYASRRREGARLRALGMTKQRGFWLYVIETLSLTIVATVLAYVVGMAVTIFVSVQFLKLDAGVMFDLELITGLGLIIVFILAIALYLYKTDTMPLRELLSYE